MINKLLVITVLGLILGAATSMYSIAFAQTTGQPNSSTGSTGSPGNAKGGGSTGTGTTNSGGGANHINANSGNANGGGSTGTGNANGVDVCKTWCLFAR